MLKQLYDQEAYHRGISINLGYGKKTGDLVTDGLTSERFPNEGIPQVRCLKG